MKVDILIKKNIKDLLYAISDCELANFNIDKKFDEYKIGDEIKLNLPDIDPITFIIKDIKFWVSIHNDTMVIELFM